MPSLKQLRNIVIYSWDPESTFTVTIADMLNRYPTINLSTNSMQQMATFEIHPSAFPWDFSTITDYQSSDSALHSSARFSSKFSSISHSLTFYLIFHIDKIVIPTSLQPHIISWYHNNRLHPGIRRTSKIIQSHIMLKISVKRLPSVSQHVRRR